MHQLLRLRRCAEQQSAHGRACREAAHFETAENFGFRCHKPFLPEDGTAGLFLSEMILTADRFGVDGSHQKNGLSKKLVPERDNP